MTNPARDLSEKEIKELVILVAAPVFKYMLKRINKYILSDSTKTDISYNSLINIIIIALASMNANILNWIEEFYYANTGEKLHADKLRFSLMKNINDQMGIKTH